EPEWPLAERLRRRAEQEPGRDREADRVEQQHLSSQSADHPQHGRDLLRLALGKVAAPCGRCRPYGKDDQAGADQLGKGPGTDPRIARHIAEAECVPQDNSPEDDEEKRDQERRPIRAALRCRFLRQAHFTRPISFRMPSVAAISFSSCALKSSPARKVSAQPLAFSASCHVFDSRILVMSAMIAAVCSGVRPGAAETERQFWIATSTPLSLKVGPSMPSTRSSLEMPIS